MYQSSQQMRKPGSEKTAKELEMEIDFLNQKKKITHGKPTASLIFNNRIQNYFPYSWE